ncbi:MAG: biopolymer transporter ExbD [Pseudomonadota bacterium]|jgi:biopolymer transport protein ExbD
MAIDVQHAVPDDEATLNTEINTTPLVDVMLVMLIIFLVTIPVIVKSIPVQLPTYRNLVTVTKPENIVIAVDSKETMYVNDAPIATAELRNMLVERLKDAVARHKSLPEVHIRGDKNVRFEAVGRVILACQQAGIQKVGFITEPHMLDASTY